MGASFYKLELVPRRYIKNPLKEYDDDEEPEQALLREVLEETGLHVTVESFVFWKQHIYTSINFFQ